MAGFILHKVVKAENCFRQAESAMKKAEIKNCKKESTDALACASAVSCAFAVCRIPQLVKCALVQVLTGRQLCVALS